MAITRSSILTKFTSRQTGTPFTANEYFGALETLRGTLEVGALALNDIVALFPLPIDATLSSLKCAFDDLGTTGAFSLGLYIPTDGLDGSALADASVGAFATGITVTSAIGWTEYRYSVKGIETVAQKAWQLAGASARPSAANQKWGEYVVGLKATTAVDVGGTISFETAFGV